MRLVPELDFFLFLTGVFVKAGDDGVVAGVGFFFDVAPGEMCTLRTPLASLLTPPRGEARVTAPLAARVIVALVVPTFRSGLFNPALTVLLPALAGPVLKFRRLYKLKYVNKNSRNSERSFFSFDCAYLDDLAMGRVLGSVFCCANCLLTTDSTPLGLFFSVEVGSFFVNVFSNL